MFEQIIEKFVAEYGRDGNETYLNGYNYTQIYQHFPQLTPFYTEFERTYDPMPLLRVMQSNNYIVPITSVVLYIALITIGPIIMKNYQPFQLNNTLAAWNLFLSLFSFYGAFRTVPHMLYRISHLTFEDTVCENVYSAYGGGANGLAVVLFILSKIPELIDTVFIVLRKKPLLFLHWYHHVTVLLFCWNAYVTRASAGLYFVSMNYTVHAIMYMYYFLQARRLVPKWFPSWIITLLQIAQMIVGTFIVCMSFYYYFYGGEKYAPGQCNNQPSNLAAGGLIYASYLILFVQFALMRFVFGSGEDDNKRKKSSKNSKPKSS